MTEYFPMTSFPINDVNNNVEYADQNIQSCADHPENDARFCIRCSVTICDQCTTVFAKHDNHETISLNELDSSRIAIRGKVKDVEKSIEQAKLSFEAIKTILSSLNKTATKSIQEVNRQLDQVIEQVEDVRRTFVTAILRKAQTALTKQASSREIRKYAQHDKKRRLYLKIATNFLNHWKGNVTDIQHIQKTGIQLLTLKVTAPKSPPSPESFSVKSFSKSFIGSLKDSLAKANQLLNESENGKSVMIIGGDHTPEKVALYNDRFKQWTSVQPLTLGRRFHAAALWNSKVIVAGGKLMNDAIADSVEQYDTQSNKWTEFPNLLHARCHHALVNLDGSLYAIGGFDKYGKPLRNAERYNVETNSWEQAFVMQTARAKLAAASLGVSIIITGGKTAGSSYLNGCETYEGHGPESHSIAPLNIGRSNHAAAAHVDTVYVFAGRKDGSRSPCLPEQYDRHAECWTLLYLGLSGPLNRASTCCNGRIYLFSKTSQSCFYVFNEHNKQIETKPAPVSASSFAAINVNWVSSTLKKPRTTSNGTSINNSEPPSLTQATKNLLVCIGGCDQSDEAVKAAVYDIVGNSLHFMAQTTKTARLTAAAVTWNNTVVVAGGLTTGGTDAVEKFDPATGKWSSLPRLQQARFGNTIVNVKGNLLVLGGKNRFKGLLKSVEHYDTQKTKWKILGNLHKERCWIGAAFCEKGVVVSGGATDHSCELYDPVSCTSAKIACLNISRFKHASAAHDDTVYVFGGWGQFSRTNLAEIEEYNADANVWTLLKARLYQPRGGLAAVCVDGLIYVIGGGKSDRRSDCSDVVDVFDQSKLQCTTVKRLTTKVRYLGAAFLKVTEDECQRIYAQK